MKMRAREKQINPGVPTLRHTLAPHLRRLSLQSSLPAMRFGTKRIPLASLTDKVHFPNMTLLCYIPCVVLPRRAFAQHEQVYLDSCDNANGVFSPWCAVAVVAHLGCFPRQWVRRTAVAPQKACLPAVQQVSMDIPYR